MSKSKKFLLEIDLGNDAFDPDPADELGRILTKVTAKIMNGSVTGKIYDVNGNHVGGYVITDQPI